MALKFLSDQWFLEYDRLKEGVEVPEGFQKISANLYVTLNNDQVVSIAYKGGFLSRVTDPEATTSITAPASAVFKGIVLGEFTSVMPALFSGELKVKGDKSALVTLARVKPTATQLELIAKLKEITDQL